MATSTHDAVADGVTLVNASAAAVREAGLLTERTRHDAQQLPGWRPLADKSPVWSGLDAAEASLREAGSLAGRGLGELLDGLADPERHDEARQALADYFFSGLLRAERDRDERGVAYHAALVGHLDREAEARGRGHRRPAADPRPGRSSHRPATAIRALATSGHARSCCACWPGVSRRPLSRWWLLSSCTASSRALSGSSSGWAAATVGYQRRR